MEDSSNLVVKDYKYWSLQVHRDQSYLGRCVIWCKREDALDLADATTEEQQELFEIFKDARRAVIRAFSPEWFNYAFLSNTDRHLHCHFIPRYSSSREFSGATFTDNQWGNNPYKGEAKVMTNLKVLEAVRLKLKEVLG